MIDKNNISMSVVRRLPIYYRYLTELENKGITRISSKELSAKMGTTASQIRQDFSYFGGFGQQGYGYVVPQLRKTIAEILGVRKKRKCILVGAGNLGHALLSIDFGELGFELVGLFDTNSKIIGNEYQGIKIMNYSVIKQFCEENKPVMAIICTPDSVVEKVSDDLCNYGIKAFWNFSHYDISIKHPEVYVENVRINDSLMTICYMLDE